MTIKEYQYIETLNTGETYERELISYFNINTNQSVDKVNIELKNKLLSQPKILKRNWFWFKGKIWIIEKDMINLSYEQFSRLDIILAENKNIENLHKLLSIYVRPLFRKYNIKTQEKIYNQLLDLDMGITQSIINLFFSLAQKSLNNITISYLNQMKKLSNQSIENK